MDALRFPRPVEGGNSGDGSPLRLGDPHVFGDAFLVNGNPHLIDWNGDGRLELVDSGGAVFAYGFEEPFADGTPVLDVKPHMAGFDPRGDTGEPPWAREIMTGYW